MIWFRTLILITCFFGLLSCNKQSSTSLNQKKQTKDNNIPALPVFKYKFEPSDTLKLDIPVILQFAKTACFGFCPVYDFTLYTDGIYCYHGHQFAKVEGKVYGLFKEDSWNQIRMKAEKIQFFQMSDNYPELEQHNIPDLPKTITKLNIGGKEKSITNSHSAPELLKELESLIESEINKLFNN